MRSVRVHYDNMQHNIKSFVLLLASVYMRGLPVSNDFGLIVCVWETVRQKQQQIQMNKNMNIGP